jgi:hypothetical protein
MARRWIVTAIVTAALVVAAVVAARVIRGDNTDTAATDRSTTTTAATSTTGGATTTTGAPTTTAPASTTTTVAPANGEPPGPCGAETAAIRAAIDAGVAGAQAGADVATCRLAATDTAWAAVQLAAKPGAQFDALTVVLHRDAGAWAIVATGGASAGCGKAPQQVIVDLGQFCAGTGGGGA